MTAEEMISVEDLKEIDFTRYICHFKGKANQSLLLFVCGIHGNEAMSVHAMHHVTEELLDQKIALNGTLIAITGNLRALKLAERFIDRDLNRVWLKDHIQEVIKEKDPQNENAELKEVYSILKEHLKDRRQDDCVVYDLHTTSSPSAPFITINDTISNRTIAKQYPLATVFGIEEFLSGPLLSYMNEIGFNAIGFEGGQHDEMASFENHIAFIWLSLAINGLIDEELEQVKNAKIRLQESSSDPYKFFEITYRYEVKKGDLFTMFPGYKNFQSIRKHSLLAQNNAKEILSQWNDRIFMPLYQKKGDDGFFIIRRIPPFFLWLSKVLRSYNFEKILLLLPGVNIYDHKEHILIVNNRIAKFMRKELFHLFGFRQKLMHDQYTTLFIRREKQ